MSTRIIPLLILAGLITACSSSTTKDDEATVEDRSTSRVGSAGNEYDGAQSYGTDTDQTGSLNPLEDPQNPLSIQIIYFEYDSSEIQSEFRPAIEAHAQYLISHPDLVVSLEGHADERGSREYNLALGELRSKAVKQQLTLIGVDTAQIRTTSYGEERPATDGHDDFSWSQNRRVEILY